MGQVLLSAEASEVAQARSDLAGADAAVTTAKAQAEVATANAARQQALFKISGAALKDVQQAQSDATSARDILRSDQAALALVRARLDVLQAGGGERGGGSGVGALATSKRPSDAALRPLMSYYTDLRREEWGFDGEPRAPLSALLPMGSSSLLP